MQTLTPQLHPITDLPINCRYQTLYVPSVDQLFCFDGPDGVSAYEYGLYEAVSLPSGAFGAVHDAIDNGGQPFAHGEYAIYDRDNDRILVGFDTNVWKALRRAASW